MANVCSVDECGKRVKARGLCSRHYSRLWYTGDPLTPLKRAQNGTYTTCTVPGCTQPNEARGLCARHRWRLRQHGNVGVDVPARKWMSQKPRKSEWPPCALDGCERSTRDGSKGYCGRHYQRVRKLGDTGPVGRLTAEPGSGHTHIRTGYRLIQVDGKQVKEHRFVMEQMIGRSLLPDENVHHRDGNKSNNEPGNLELWTTVQPSGKRAEDLVAYAHEILTRYPDEVLKALAN